MRTFCEFVEQKDNAINLVEQAVSKIYEEAEKNPILKDILVKEGWGDAWNAVKSGWQGLWGGAKSGGQAAWAGAKDALYGQKAYYDAVMKNMNGLVAAVQKTAADQSTTGEGKAAAMNMVGPNGWLTTMQRELKDQAPQFQRGQVTYTPASGTSRGGSTQFNYHQGTPMVPGTPIDKGVTNLNIPTA